MIRKPTQSLVGRRVEFVKSTDVLCHVEYGTKGTVNAVNATGGVTIEWDTGIQSELIWDVGDRWSIVKKT